MNLPPRESAVHWVVPPTQLISELRHLCPLGVCAPLFLSYVALAPWLSPHCAGGRLVAAREKRWSGGDLPLDRLEIRYIALLHTSRSLRGVRNIPRRQHSVFLGSGAAVSGSLTDSFATPPHIFRWFPCSCSLPSVNQRMGFKEQPLKKTHKAATLFLQSGAADTSLRAKALASAAAQLHQQIGKRQGCELLARTH